MASTMWEAAATSLAKSGTAESVDPGTYKVEIVGGRPLVRNGEVERALFLDFEVLSGPSAGESTSIYLNVPEPSSRGAMFYFSKKTAGFPMAEIFATLPDDLEEGLKGMVAGLLGWKGIAEFGMGQGNYSDRNDLVATRSIEADEVPAAEAPAEDTNDDDPGF